MCTRKVLGTVPRAALIAARINGRLWFPPVVGCLNTDGNTTLMLSAWEGRAEVGREEVGVGNLHRAGHLKTRFGPAAGSAWGCGIR